LDYLEMSLDEHAPAPDRPEFPAPPLQPAPQKQGTSGLAVAGLILAFVLPLVGFILSLVAVFKTGAGKAKGRGLAITGLIVSIVIMGVGAAVVVSIVNSTVADPGCTSAKEAILNAPQNGDPAALRATVDKLNAASAKAKHDDVREASKAMADDFTQLIAVTKTGQLPDGLEDKIAKDGARIDELCTIGS
jgi:hypothetical protein